MSGIEHSYFLNSTRDNGGGKIREKKRHVNKKHNTDMQHGDPHLRPPEDFH